MVGNDLFWVIMILCIMVYVGSWGGGLHNSKNVTYTGNVDQVVDAVDAINIDGGDLVFSGVHGVVGTHEVN